MSEKNMVESPNRGKTVEEEELEDIEKDRVIIQGAQKVVSTNIAFDLLYGIDTSLYRRYKVLRSIIAGQKRGASK